jgi:heme/copper-type cytochrome/quinol oxidase subunit 4
MKSTKKYAIAFAIYFVIGILAMWLSLRDTTPTAEKLEWTINADK